MKLLKGIIRPGTVEEVLDNGIIKVSAPGLFSYKDDSSVLPPVQPWQIGSNCNSYSSPIKGEEVWIMNFEDNPLQLYWFRKDETVKNTNINVSGENVEVLCNRDINGEWASIYFSDGSGWVVSKGTSYIQICPNGSIHIDNSEPNRLISINSRGINLGSEESKYGAAYGDVTEEALTSLIALLRATAYSAMGNPYTVAIGKTILQKIGDFEKLVPKITSTNVYID